jgi:ATPase subunit of ABC transporter with duplicated ATPase domains
MFSKMMLSGANVIILDNPTAHLDLESISAVNEGVQKFKGSVIFNCQDHEFLQTVANRIIEIDVTVKEDMSSTYDEYLVSRRGLHL